MAETIAPDIEKAEHQLRHAMLTSDLRLLDALIAPHLVFTTHFGTLLSKQDDLEMHRSGALKFSAIEWSEQKVLHLVDVAFVSVRARLGGTFKGSPFQDDIRFSRVWQRASDDTWQVVAGQATVVQA